MKVSSMVKFVHVIICLALFRSQEDKGQTSDFKLLSCYINVYILWCLHEACCECMLRLHEVCSSLIGSWE